MTPAVFYTDIVAPGLQRMTAPFIEIPVTTAAQVLVMAIAGQESGWMARRQNGGPARGYWQFERYGGVSEVLQKCSRQMGALCAMLDVPPDADVIFEAMAWNDPLACGMARLLLWGDPAPLPTVGDVNGGYDYYIRNWRPGVPRPSDWPGNYEQAMKAVGLLDA